MTQKITDELKDYILRAETGDVASQVYVGWAYLEGKITARDVTVAEKWLRRATEQGSFEGTFRLAMMLIQRRDGEGVELLRNLSDKEYAPASYEFGNCLYTGNLVSRDSDQAIGRWEAAAQGGHILAKMKALKYYSAHAHVYEKPLFFVKVVVTLFQAIAIYLRDERDPRVLGTFS